MIDPKLLKSKLEACALYVRRLNPLACTPFGKFSADYVVATAAERLVQLLVDAAVDVNNHLLLEAGRSTPRDYYSSFTGLAAARVLPSDLARALAGTTGLRNRLVHEYEEVDPRIFPRSLPALLRSYRRYILAIRKHAGF